MNQIDVQILTQIDVQIDVQIVTQIVAQKKVHEHFQMRPNFDDGFKLEPIKIDERGPTTSTSSTVTTNNVGRCNDNFDSISIDSGDVTDGIKKYVSVAIVV